jgi:hypothetical protein
MYVIGLAMHFAKDTVQRLGVRYNNTLKDDNFIHGARYPRISDPAGTGMEG